MSKVVIVTGGSRGIGKGIVEYLAENNYKIVLNYNRSEAEAIEIKKNLNLKGYEVEIFKADVSMRNEVQELVEYTINKFGKIDVLINNAGIALYKMFTDVTDEEWNNIINANLTSVFYACREVLPNMIHNKSGCIINISSIWGIVGSSCEVAYSASKAGIDGLTKALAKEIGPSNIRVNSIAPGSIYTDMISDITKEELEDVKKQTPLGKIGNSIDIAKCVKWLIEDEFTTGQVISPNGGWVIT